MTALNKLDSLIDSGKLANPVVAKLADKFGLIGILSPETQLFEKTMGEFLPAMADTYGARVTNQHEKIFLNTIPRLQQTEAGKRLLVDVLKKKAEADNVRYKVEREILKENNYIPPFNLRDMIEERSRGALEKNYNDTLNLIRYGVESETPKGHVPMLSPSGEMYHIPEDKIESAMKSGLQPV